MTSPFHEGELQVQKRSGGRHIGEAVGRSIRGQMAEAAQDFLQRLPFVVLGAADRQGEVWSTHLAGEPGFVRPHGDRTVVIEGGILPGDPLADTFRKVGWPVGMIGIEPSSRRRIRLNGRMPRRDRRSVEWEPYSPAPLGPGSRCVRAQCRRPPWRLETGRRLPR